MAFKAVKQIIIGCTLMLAAGVGHVQARSLEIVAFGDSLMAGYELPESDGFPARLEEALKRKGYDVTITNVSVSGDTSADGLARLDWSVPDGVDGLILELGANDALRGIEPAETRMNLERIVARLKERGIPVMLAGMAAPPNMGPDYAASFNPIYRELAEVHGLSFYPVFVEAYILDEGLKLGDGMHPNAKGVEAVVTDFLPYAERFLEAILRD